MQPVLFHIKSFPETQIYSYAVNGCWAREATGGWAQIRLSILKFSDFEIRLSSVNTGGGVRFNKSMYSVYGLGNINKIHSSEQLISVGAYWAHVFRGSSRGLCIGIIYTHPSRVGWIHLLFLPTTFSKFDSKDFIIWWWAFLTGGFCDGDHVSPCEQAGP